MLWPFSRDRQARRDLPRARAGNGRPAARRGMGPDPDPARKVAYPPNRALFRLTRPRFMMTGQAATRDRPVSFRLRMLYRSCTEVLEYAFHGQPKAI